MRSLALVTSLLAASSSLACASGPRSAEPLPEGPPNQLGQDDPHASAAEVPPSEEVAAARPENTIYRDELLRATAGGKPAYLLRELAPEPYRPRGAREGWIIGSVFPSDPGLCAPGCDLMPGDIILTVNGSPLERPEQLSELISQLESMTTLEVRA
jgi:hypothetical protein